MVSIHLGFLIPSISDLTNVLFFSISCVGISPLSVENMANQSFPSSFSPLSYAYVIISLIGMSLFFNVIKVFLKTVIKSLLLTTSLNTTFIIWFVFKSISIFDSYELKRNNPQFNSFILFIIKGIKSFFIIEPCCGAINSGSFFSISIKAFNSISLLGM